MADLRVPDLNQTIVAGRLTRDPDLKYTGSGSAYCRFSVANTRYFKGKDGSRNEETVFVDVVVWGPSAEFVGEKIRKGRPVLVEGNLHSNQWEDRDTGKKRSKLEVRARRVTPLDWDDNGQGGQRSGNSAQAQGGGRPAPRPIEEPLPEDDIPF